MINAYTQAIQARSNIHGVSDSRAAASEKLGALKDALKDSCWVIKDCADISAGERCSN